MRWYPQSPIVVTVSADRPIGCLDTKLDRIDQTATVGLGVVQVDDFNDFNDVLQVDDFKDLWAATELRRFADGRIFETVVWAPPKASFFQRRKIIHTIVRELMLWQDYATS